MDFAPYYKVSRASVLSFGGFSCVRPEEWSRYLKQVVEQHYPGFYKHQGVNDPSTWTDNNCILASLEKYLFTRFGLVIPPDNLFKIYNHSGEGLSPDVLIEAISAVIEPLGFEIDRVLVPDDELRAGLGHPGKMRDLSHAGEFDGKAGICMINIREGYSHAFFWERMEKLKFYKDQFRMALLVRRKDPCDSTRLSAVESMHAYCRFVEEYSQRRFKCRRTLDRLQAVSRSLVRFVNDHRNGLLPGYRETIDEKLLEALSVFRSGADREPNKGFKGDDEAILNAGHMIRRVFQEIDDIC